MAPKQRLARRKRRQTIKIDRNTPVPSKPLPRAPLPAPLVVSMIDGMADLVQHESILDFVVSLLPEAILQSTSQKSLSSMLRNFRVNDLSEVVRAEAGPLETEVSDSFRPSKFTNWRLVLDPCPIIFRPINPAYKEIVRLGLSQVG